jgi:hypothetical protein
LNEQKEAEKVDKRIIFKKSKERERRKKIQRKQNEKGKEQRNIRKKLGMYKVAKFSPSPHLPFAYLSVLHLISYGCQIFP